MRLDGHFLKADLYEYASGEQRLDIVYLDSLDKREVILTEHFASQELLYKAFVETPLAATLSAQARQLVPAISLREERNLAEMADLQFEVRDVDCSGCGARPGEPCHGSPDHCPMARRGFLLTLVPMTPGARGSTHDLSLACSRAMSVARSSR